MAISIFCLRTLSNYFYCGHGLIYYCRVHSGGFGDDDSDVRAESAAGCGGGGEGEGYDGGDGATATAASSRDGRQR
jgi:hypothetical protein